MREKEIRQGKVGEHAVRIQLEAVAIARVGGADVAEQVEVARDLDQQEPYPRRIAHPQVGGQGLRQLPLALVQIRSRAAYGIGARIQLQRALVGSQGGRVLTAVIVRVAERGMRARCRRG